MVPDRTTSQIPLLQANSNSFASPAPSGLRQDTGHKQERSLPSPRICFSMKCFQIHDSLFDLYDSFIGSCSYQHFEDERSRFKMK